MCCSLTSEVDKTVKSHDLPTQSERLNFSIVPLSRPADNLLTKYSTEMLGLLPLASIQLSGMHYFVWHSYHLASILDFSIVILLCDLNSWNQLFSKHQ